MAGSLELSREWSSAREAEKRWRYNSVDILFVEC
jgi:hypothetical protein